MIVAALLIHLALAQSPSRPLLDVPFVAQSPELCGGAAVSMVFRYWGLHDVHPQDFAALVSRADEGILTSALAKSVRDWGWTALVDTATSRDGHARLRDHLDRGRPIIALIEVAPRTYHYVVVVGSTDREIVFHDPARAAFRVLEWRAFDEAWSRAHRWMMVALPPADLARSSGSTERIPSSRAAASSAELGTTRSAELGTTPPYGCSPMVAHAIEAALGGNTSDAEAELSAASKLCPNDAAVWREFAGLRFAAKRYAEAAALAGRAARLAPKDAYSWELLATSRYLSGRSLEALDAWNHIGAPAIGSIDIEGADRTRLPVVMNALDLEPRSMLTADTFTRSWRRLRDVPVAASAHMKLQPADGGVANISALLIEKSPYPRSRADWYVVASKPVLQRELRVDVAGLTGAGESAFAAWRFARHRPRVSAGVAFPSPSFLPGITTFSAMWEEQNYASPVVSGDAIREIRRRAGLQWSDWSSGWLKWEAGGALDRFNGSTHVSLNGTLTVRSLGDRAVLTASAAEWSLLSDERRFATASLRGALRSSTDLSTPMLSASAGVERATTRAPLALWPSAGTGIGSERASLLRGHQLIEDGFVTGEAFGRTLVNGTLEYSRPVRAVRAFTVALAGFLDAARASSRREDALGARHFVDAGVGLRVKLPGSIGAIRFDIAHPLGAGRLILSAGWLPTWPR